ncbi:MAG: Mur ligase family protein [Candidatus Paceibacterota bacterium]|jgi:UDP-N-acetylmuramoyl-tripeptide--D-alanyl-D-alanine ligase
MKDIFKKIVLTIITFQAKFLLKKNNPTVIAITGNLGKTSTKDFIYAALKNNLLDSHGESLVVSSKKSMNSEFGIPLTILELPSGWNNLFLWIKIVFSGFVKMFDKNVFKYLVLEVGADSPNDIKNVCKYIKPDITVLTGFAKVPVHIEFFGGDRSRLVREKKYLVEAIKEGGTFIYNLDDEDCRKIAEENSSRNIKLKSFSIKDKSADICASDISIDTHQDDNKILKINGISAKLNLKSGKFTKINMRGSLGDAVIYSVLPSILISEILNIDIDKAINEIEKTKRTNGRMRVLDGIYNSVIVDDTYNSSPKAVEHGIETIKKIKPTGKKIVVLGDMLELGDFTKSEHERIGELVVGNCDILITSGIRANIISSTAIKNGMSPENVFATNNSIEAGKELLRILEREVEGDYKLGKNEKEVGGDLIFVKGSQGSRMERVVKMILAENHDSNIDLVRQDKIWQEKN